MCSHGGLALLTANPHTIKIYMYAVNYMGKNKSVGETVKSWALWRGGHGVKPRHLRKILIHHCRAMWQPPGLPHVTFPLVKLNKNFPIIRFHLVQKNSSTYMGIFQGIFSFLTMLYGCPISILVKLCQNFARLVKWSACSNFLIRTSF